MAENSKIEWTTHTLNLWWGCVEVHEGCDNCYARTLANRYKTEWGGSGLWGIGEPRRMIKSAFSQLDKFQNAAKKAGEMHRVFVGSMMDIFEKPMPLIGQGIDTGDLRKQFFAAIEMGVYPNLDFLLLTKRPSNINKYIPKSWKIAPPENVMFGTSIVNQETVRLAEQLLYVAGRKFISCEPMIGAVDLSAQMPGLDWIICGGESGHHVRPMEVQWCRDLKAQTEYYGKAFFMKQGSKSNWADFKNIESFPEDLRVRNFPPQPQLKTTA
jgi:protein gp37